MQAANYQNLTVNGMLMHVSTAACMLMVDIEHVPGSKASLEFEHILFYVDLTVEQGRRMLEDAM